MGRSRSLAEAGYCCISYSASLDIDSRLLQQLFGRGGSPSILGDRGILVLLARFIAMGDHFFWATKADVALCIWP